MGERERERERDRETEKETETEKEKESKGEGDRARAHTTSMCELLKARAGVALSKSRHPCIKDPAANGSIFGSLN